MAPAVSYSEHDPAIRCFGPAIPRNQCNMTEPPLMTPWVTSQPAKTSVESAEAASRSDDGRPFNARCPSVCSDRTTKISNTSWKKKVSSDQEQHQDLARKWIGFYPLGELGASLHSYCQVCARNHLEPSGVVSLLGSFKNTVYIAV